MGIANSRGPEMKCVSSARDACFFWLHFFARRNGCVGRLPLVPDGRALTKLTRKSSVSRRRNASFQKKVAFSRARDDTCIFHMRFRVAFLIVFDDTF